ncbi:Eco57I restriction-modification methylase domain-containing protein [sulfur-oxidizing endosymbiont of Gigantopelta aegis]|uniref:Eco57I restriction-modification methylase domain-containing protein n=2 Tax=sulfur-oxidizing endosymbiont of Gigantopelta aegis TaxID=2794934 RepID=UPI001BE3F7AF|nr:hypothetical protein [sulfur-oxidizing endosymbiont of Gigantopelta aegis]
MANSLQIHETAVIQTARVNILIAISDLLDNNKGTDIEIPILLADAVYSPARNPKKDELIVSYKIGSEVADLEILLPSELAFDRSRLDSVFLLMDNLVSKSTQWRETEKKINTKKLITSNEMKEWRSPLKHTYEKILDLHERNWNGIWFRIVRNFFWSAIAGKFDVVVGNPPWVRWSKLPELYRERIKPTCDHYGIFSKQNFMVEMNLIYQE